MTVINLMDDPVKYFITQQVGGSESEIYSIEFDPFDGSEAKDALFEAATEYRRRERLFNLDHQHDPTQEYHLTLWVVMHHPNVEVKIRMISQSWNAHA